MQHSFLTHSCFLHKGTVFGKWFGSVQEADDDDLNINSPSKILQSSVQMSMSDKIQRLPSARETAFMYKYAAGYLRAQGYEHYEVSSYALVPPKEQHGRKSFRSRHNQIYWAIYGQWFALGLGATSFVNGRLLTRPRALSDYERWVNDQEPAQSNTVGDDTETAASLDLLTETILKRLRTSDGLSLDWVKNRFGDSCVEAVLLGSQLGINLSLVELDMSSNTLKLVDPSGFLFSNTIISNIFMEVESQFKH